MTDPSDPSARKRSGPGPGAGRTRTARTKFAAVVIVCAKCAKRQGLRPGAVRDLLKRGFKETERERKTERARRAQDPCGAPYPVEKPGRRKLCVAESGCLGPCPKRALAIATGASLAQGRVVLLDPAAGAREAIAAVLGGSEPRPAPSDAQGSGRAPPISAPMPI